MHLFFAPIGRKLEKNGCTRGISMIKYFYYFGKGKGRGEMEPFQIAILIALIGAAVLVLYSRSQNRQPSEGEMPPGEPATEPVREEAAQQHTIYAFERQVQVQVCPRCDGENSMGRQSCCICGFEFRKGVWGL